MRTSLASPRTLSNALLGSTPTRTALVGGGGRLSYGALRARVEGRAAELDLGARSVVVLSGDQSIEFVVTYLALVHGGHVPLLANDHVDDLARVWQAVTVRVVGDDLDTSGGPGRRYDIHPDLALLLSTSGSTGSPKLVRLSHRNLVANAQAIGDSLGLDEHDRTITSLPLHYCYGLSVLHSHLAVGATVALTGASVVDPCFRELAHAQDVTTFAGVPHTFDLLDRAGADLINTPSLRLLTQAGGRLAPESVTRWARRACSWDADFVVMYGQTEATARMACLPPGLIDRYPGAIGAPIVGGSFELRPVDDQPDGVGELIYRGDNVMMGYAVDHRDLALGHTVDELSTGDLARFHADDGVYEIVGRRTRFVKPFGLRIDLDRIEHEVRRITGIVDVAVAGDDERIVALAPESDVGAVAEQLGSLCGVPASRVSVGAAPCLPRTNNGKIDYAAVMASAGGQPAVDRGDVDGGDVDLRLRDGEVWRAFAGVLGDRPVGPTDTFVSLGGDSLSYVECSIRLEAALGTIPSDWHVTPISELASLSARRVRRGPRAPLGRIDTTVVLRAAGICLVVATHMHLWHMPGGAHIMLAVAGYNMARFMGPIESPRERIAAGLRTAARAAVPTVIWVGAGIAVTGAYGVGALLLVNNYAGPRSHDGDHWHFWFIEVFVHLVIISTLLLAIPAVRRTERRFAYLAPMALLFATLLLRMEWAQAGDWYNLRFRTHGVAWFFVLGWLIRQSRSWWQRVATTVVCLAVVPGFFRVDRRDWLIAIALIGLVWLRDAPFPKRLIRPAGVLAAASMWIYLTHFTFWPMLDRVLILEVAYVLTIASGVGVWLLAARSSGLLNTWRERRLRPSNRPLESTPIGAVS